MITVHNLTKKFGFGATELLALKGISFDVPTGQFLAITGRSGAGKSTTLYQLSMLDRPTGGEISIDGTPTTAMTGEQSQKFRLLRFGFIFQDYALLPTLTAVENVMVPMLMQGKSHRDARVKSLDALGKVGLASLVDHLPSQLSGGEQQRVSVARAIVHEPNYLFADEPTANLDVESSDMILDIFLRLNQRSDLTIVMVTHEPEYAKLADRNIELLDGQIIRDEKQEKGKVGEAHHRA